MTNDIPRELTRLAQDWRACSVEREVMLRRDRLSLYADDTSQVATVYANGDEWDYTVRGPRQLGLLTGRKRSCEEACRCVRGELAGLLPSAPTHAQLLDRIKDLEEENAALEEENAALRRIVHEATEEEETFAVGLEIEGEEVTP